MTFGFTPAEQMEEKTVCYRHPTVETGLRCNRCGRYICSRCAVRTPVGYRCPDCVRQQQDAFFNAGQSDYIIAAIVAFACTIPIVYILSRLGLLFIIILGLPAGGLVSEIVHRALRRRRGRYTWAIVALAIVAGGIAANFEIVRLILVSGQVQAAAVLLPPAIITALCAVAAAARFRYGK